MNSSNSSQELLAPAGHVESFHAALESGADAVYLGLKQLSARASATNFSLEDLSILLPFAHRRGKRVYVAMNSLVTAVEFPTVMHTLQSLSDLKVDGLIIQDPGLLFLVRKYFPDLPLHASTLMAIHNHAGVEQMARLGVQRVVLARELTMQEIAKIAAKTSVELEIFIHGALCFSYSGMCLTSSFRGGHSGLQGRCVQPCRLLFKQGRKEGFFLSCNDLCTLPLIPELKKLRLAALKIEGRKKSADYIAQVVRAYRIVLDARPDEEQNAMAQAQEMLVQAPSRRLSTGFLGDRPGEDVLVPGRSGFSGLWVGDIEEVKPRGVLVLLHQDIGRGDRLRPESRADREESGFTVSEILSESGDSIPSGRAGSRILLPQKGNFRPGDRLYRVGVRMRTASSIWQEIRRDVPEGISFKKKFPGAENIIADWQFPSINPHKATEALLLKIDSAQDLVRAFQSPAQNVILTATRPNLERLVKQRLGADQKKRFIWSIPPLLSEKDLEYYRPAIGWFRERGFRMWEVNNWAHFDLFPDRKDVFLTAGYRFNLRNTAALAEMAENGCRWGVLSLELTREELQRLSRDTQSVVPIVTVYAWPPLFTSRLIPKLQEDKPFTTPRQETYLFRKRWGYSYIHADRPINWFAQVGALRAFGFRNFLIDLSEGPHDQGKHMERLLSGFKRAKPDQPYSVFNFDLRAVPQS